MRDALQAIAKAAAPALTLAAGLVLLDRSLAAATARLEAIAGGLAAVEDRAMRLGAVLPPPGGPGPELRAEGDEPGFVDELADELAGADSPAR